MQAVFPFTFLCYGAAPEESRPTRSTDNYLIFDPDTINWDPSIIPEDGSSNYRPSTEAGVANCGDKTEILNDPGNIVETVTFLSLLI